MKNSTLMELVAKWERDAKPPVVEDGGESAKLGNALAKGVRVGLGSAANDLKALILLLGNES